MKILNTEEFAKLPEGVLFSEWKPNFLGDLQIKGEAYVSRGWFSFTSAPVNSIDISLEEDLESGDSIPVDLEHYTKDVLPTEQLFAVWESDDLRKLISKLETAIEVTVF